MPPLMDQAQDDGAAGMYRARLSRFRKDREAAQERSDRLGKGRLVAFVLAVLLFLVAELVAGDAAWATFSAGPISIAAAAAGVLALLAFLRLVRRHRKVRAEEAHLAALVALNEEALARLARDWAALPPAAAPTGWARLPAAAIAGDPSTLSPEETPGGLEVHPYALDLDIVGPASLERLFNTVSTGPGARTLRSWLLEGAQQDTPRDGLDAAEVTARQEAVVALAGDVDFRQELAAHARTAGLHRDDRTESLLSWAEEPSWLDERRRLVWAARVIPPATLLLVVFDMAGIVSGAWWIAGLLAGLVYMGTFTQPTGAIFERISRGHGSVGAYARPLGFLEERLAQITERSSRLAGLSERLREGEGSASRALERVGWWLTISDVRASGMTHFVLQTLLFWDVHVLAALEQWRRTNGSSLATWLRALGETEALAALSALRADHPDWCMPEEIEEPRIEGEAVGHPLLAADVCVRNDVEVGPPGTFLFVTGSNMSGKSTFLRAVGVNAVLARAGAPVCAHAFRSARLSVVTSMRTEDSLSEGVSAFMAELRRVAMVVRQARRSASGVPASPLPQGAATPTPLLAPPDPATPSAPQDPVTLYLLDEPLQGTNAAERRIAIQIVLRQLLGCRAIGAVATHDLQLHETEQLEDAARLVHFMGRVEQVAGEPRLSFDYRLREGIATSTNALDLLRLVGLGESRSVGRP